MLAQRSLLRTALSRAFADLEVLEKRRNFTIFKVPNHVNKRGYMQSEEYQDKAEPLVCSFAPYILHNPRISEKQYYWCSCGLSRKQPFCDSSHMQTPFKPVVFKVEEPVKEVSLCMCKHTSQPPYCDGKACQAKKVLSSS